MKLVSGIVDSGFFAQSALSAEVATKDNLGRNISETYLTAVDLTPYQEKSAMSGYLTIGDSAQFITALPADLVYTGDLNDYATKDFVNDNIDSATSGLLPTSSFSSVSGSFITALPSDLVYTADITGKLDTSVYATDSAMFSGAIDYVSANISDPVTSPLGTILVNGSEIEATNSAINLTGVKTPYTSSIPVNVSELYELYPLNFGTFNTGSILNISSDGYGYNPKPYIVILGNDSANNLITLEFRNQSGSLGNIVSAISAGLFEGQPTGYNFELSSYTLGSGVDELAWKTDLNDLPGYDYLQANYQPKSAMTAYLTKVGALQNFQRKQDMTAYQPVSGMSAYLTTGDSANFYPTSNPSGFISEIPDELYLTALYVEGEIGPGQSEKEGVAITQTGINLYNELGDSVNIDKNAVEKWDDTNNVLTANSAAWNEVSAKQPSGDYYSASNPSGFITGVDLTPYQTVEGMTAYQPAGDYLTTADSAQFITALPADLVYTADITGFATTADLTSKLDKSDSANFLLTSDSSNFYTTANESGFITGIPDDLTLTTLTVTGQIDPEQSELEGVIITQTGISVYNELDSSVDIDINSVENWNSTYNTVSTNSASWTASTIPSEVTAAASAVSSNSANWNSTYNTVSANSADWSVSEEISGVNGIKISESADKVIIEVSANYATEDWVTAQGYLTAHQDLSNYQTTAGMTAYQSAGDYYSASNPSGFLTAVPTGYATEDWVTGQGYITGINYNTGSI